jgi:hypothetical protein
MQVLFDNADGQYSHLLTDLKIDGKHNTESYTSDKLRMINMSGRQPINYGRFSHLSMPDSEWLQVADNHATVDEAAAKLYALPIEEFRKIPYQPPPLAPYAPVEGQDVQITKSHVTVRDGTSIGVRIYQHISNEKSSSFAPIYYNIHGGGRYHL